MYGFSAKVDTREFVPKDKHPMIIKAFNNLKPGELMELVNDHASCPHCQFIMERPDQFIWEYIEQGPKVWRFAIEKK